MAAAKDKYTIFDNFNIHITTDNNTDFFLCTGTG